MGINVTAFRKDDALTSYANCEWSTEELTAQTGKDDISDYLGKEDFYMVK